MSKNPAILLAIFLALGACRRSPPPAPTAQPSPPAAAPKIAPLPEVIAGFSAGVLETEGGAIRRRYTRPGVTITVTLARLPMSGEQYAEWVKTSTGGFPQAALDVAADRGNGFYQCDERE